MLGTFMTDMNLGIFTAKLDLAVSIPRDHESIGRRVSPVRRRRIQGVPGCGGGGSKPLAARFKHPSLTRRPSR
jgi:hypothetical protein